MVGVLGLVYLDAPIVGKYVCVLVMPFMRGSLVVRVSLLGLQLGLMLWLGLVCYTWAKDK